MSSVINGSQQGRAAVAREAHNLEVVGASPAPATTFTSLPVATAAKIATILQAIEELRSDATIHVSDLRPLFADRDVAKWLDQMHAAGLIRPCQIGGA